MAGNLPIKFNIPIVKTQQTLPQVTLPPLKPTDIPLPQNGSIFTSNPIIDITKTFDIEKLNSLFEKYETTEDKAILIQDTKKESLSDEEFEKIKEEIRISLLEKSNNPKDIDDITALLNKENIEIAQILCQNKNFCEVDNLKQIQFIIKKINKTTKETAGIICQNKNFLNQKNTWNIVHIITEINEDNKEIAEIICKNENFSTSENIWNIKNILKEINKTNKETAKYICQNKTLTNPETIPLIPYILNVTNKKDIDFALKILPVLIKKFNDEELDFNNFVNIYETITAENKELFLEKLPLIMLERRDILKTGDKDLTSSDIYNFIFKNAKEIENSLKILTEGEFIYSFAFKTDKLEEFLKNISALTKSEHIEDILQIFNPKESKKGKAILQEIEVLKSKNKELSKLPLKDKIAPMKENSEKIKELKSKITDLESFITSLQKTGKGNRDIISILKILYAIEYSCPEETATLINIIKNKEIKDKNVAITQFVNKKIFEIFDINFDKNLSDKLELDKSEYLSELLESGSFTFKENFNLLIKVIANHPNLSISAALQTLKQNQITKEQYEEAGINYERYINADENSFKEITVKVDLEKEKAALVAAIEKDFNSDKFKLIPKDEQEKIFLALEEKGIILKEIKEPIFDKNNNKPEEITVIKLYKGNEPIDFSCIGEVISTIRTVLNKEEFWSKTNQNEEINEAKKTLYSHFTKLRVQELKNIKNSGVNGKSIKFKIKQVDMTDIKHSLFLGNHSGCCTALSTGLTKYTVPTYIMNRLISAFEIMTENTAIGNTMIYIAEIDGIPSLILDNIEIKGKYQFNDQIRDGLFDYAKQFVKEIGKPDMPIYAGPYRHKLNMPSKKSDKIFKILGSTGEQEVYIDAEGDFKVNGNHIKAELYRLQ